MSTNPQKNSNAMVGLILGILSIVITGIGLILGIIGIVISKKAINELEQSESRGSDLSLARSGLTCSIVGVVLNAILIILGIIGLLAFFSLTTNNPL